MCNFEIPITIPETNQTFVVTPATNVIIDNDNIPNY